MPLFLYLIESFASSNDTSGDVFLIPQIIIPEYIPKSFLNEIDGRKLYAGVDKLPE